MTCLPPERVKSPVCDATTFRFGFAAMSSAKPFVRSIAGAEPVVPSSWTMFTGPVAPFSCSSSQSPAFLPSATKSEPRKVL